MSTESISANRINSRKSTGPENTNSTRFNATTHGLLAAGITELDDAEGYRETLRDLAKEKDPLGQVETFLVKSAALDMIRWRRAGRLEAEYITQVLHPPIHAPGTLAALSQLEEGRIVDPGLPASMHCEGVQLLVSTFLRYESAIVLRLFRTLHELERLQRMRRGEQLPAPGGWTRCESKMAGTSPRAQPSPDPHRAPDRSRTVSGRPGSPTTE